MLIFRDIDTTKTETTTCLLWVTHFSGQVISVASGINRPVRKPLVRCPAEWFSLVLRRFPNRSNDLAVFDTTSPAKRAVFLDSGWQTAPRESHPRQDLCRPPSIWQDGSIIVADGIVANSLPSAVSRSGGNRWAPYILAALIGAAGKRVPPFFLPAPTGGLGLSLINI